jgi:predicted DCC family thiol-disulfide oxidoreductase YuxK
MTPQPLHTTIVLYDRDCGLCIWTMSKVLAWDRRGELRPVALQDPEATRLLDGMDDERKMASWHLVTPDGQVHSAGAALAPLLRLLPGGRPLAAAAAHFPRATDRLYFAVANRRSKLGRLFPSTPDPGER